MDTSLAVLSAIQAATILGLNDQRERLRELVDGMDFAPLVNGSGPIRDGVSATGEILPSVWDTCVGESALVELLRGYRNRCLSDLNVAHSPPAVRGRGLITELAALLTGELRGKSQSLDRWGTDWHAERLRHLHDGYGIEIDVTTLDLQPGS